MKQIALFGGRFDPVHNGHLAIAKEVLQMGAADEVWFSLEYQHQWRPIVASVEDRKKMLQLAIEEEILKQVQDDNTKVTNVIPAKAGTYPLTSSDAIGSSLGNNWIPDQVRDDSLKGKLKIDETPIKLGGLTETISVIRELRKTVKDNIVFLCGSDQLPTFPKWTHWEELEKELQFLVVARKGSPIENVPLNCTILEDPTYVPLEDSATRIRNLIKEGKSIHGLVPDGVEKYIMEHKLYI